MSNLAIFGGEPVFKTIRSSANLVTPDINNFLEYLRESYDDHNLYYDGPATRDLEERLAISHGVAHCITFPNCLSSIICCLAALNVRKGSEVITPSFAYRRFGDLIAWLGLVPHYCEVDASTLTPTVEMVEACINENTSAILLVQPMILISDFTAHHQMAQQRGLPLIIDSVEAPYSTCNGQRIGSFGDIECFSMHASKLINACDGGYATTNDDTLAMRLRSIRSSNTGIGMEMNEMHAVMALASIDGLKEQLKRNRARYHLYKQLLAKIPGITLIEYNEHEACGYKNILVRLEDDWPLSREGTITVLHAENILARPFWSPALHTNKTQYKTISGELPITDRLASNHMLLPCGDFLELGDIREIASLLTLVQKEGLEIKRQLGDRSISPPAPISHIANISSLLGWDAIEDMFRDIFKRRFFTSNGPLLKKLESLLELQLDVNHAICVSNESHAFMTAIMSIWEDSVLFCTSLSPMLKRVLSLIAPPKCGETDEQILVGVYTLEDWKIKGKKIREGGSKFLVVLNDIAATTISCVCTNDDELAERVRNTRTIPGIRKKIPVYATGNGRTSEAQAALALIKLAPF